MLGAGAAQGCVVCDGLTCRLPLTGGLTGWAPRNPWGFGSCPSSEHTWKIVPSVC